MPRSKQKQTYLLEIGIDTKFTRPYQIHFNSVPSKSCELLNLRNIKKTI